MKRLAFSLILLSLLITAFFPVPVAASPASQTATLRQGLDKVSTSSTCQLDLPAQGGALRYTQGSACDTATLHYHRRNADYDGWGLYVWGQAVPSVTWESSLSPSGTDDFGLFWQVKMNAGATELNYIVHKGNEKDPGPDQLLKFAEKGCEIWLVQGKATQFTDPQTAIDALVIRLTVAPPPGPDQVILHYRRVKEDYDGWGLHIWGPTAVQGVTWGSPLLPAGQDEYGLYWIVNMQAGAATLNYIVHKGDEKDPGPDQSLDIRGLGREIWLIQGSGDLFTNPDLAKESMKTVGIGDIKNKAQAHWVTADTIAWPNDFLPGTVFQLLYDPEGAIRLTPEGLSGGQAIPLEYVDDNLAPALALEFPHLWKSAMLKIPAEYLAQVPELLKGQVAVAATSKGVVKAAALQIPGVLDDLYAENTKDEPLGVVWDSDIPTLHLWAPTAKSITLHLFDSPLPAGEGPGVREFPMTWHPQTGIWSVTGEPGWKGQFYLYEVEVFVRQQGKVVRNFVTDPYSLSLSTNSKYSQIVDLSDPELTPQGWKDGKKPPLEHPTDIVLYELQVRDFSINDPTVPAEHRGGFLAFTDLDSNGMSHLKRLAEAGVTHVHLLPAFDVATIEEDKAQWEAVDFAQLATYPPNSSEQQKAANAVRGRDGYNWGYDPFHYTAPEGSYATDPEGAARIREFRQMVMSLNGIGLRVVMDVVYNHTTQSGQSEKSVLDKIVPGYYHRLDANGNVATSTCCANTATEHAMMEKLMLDSLHVWAVDYKVDGFRFDLMGHHMVSNMVNVRAMLDSLTPENDGVDGKAIYVYGEGWNFGEVANGARGENATQSNLAGTGIGTFNDRLRDAARGGSPFTGKQVQGFVTGLYTDPNETGAGDEAGQLSKLLVAKDTIALGLAGNLSDYTFRNALGQLVDGTQILYNGQPAGYTQMPQENIVYVSAHDNETLFDAVQYKAPFTATLEDRARMQWLGIDLVALSQGIPFFHAGDELLRSKSLDRDSYDSGDWFNKLDWSYESNNWGVGLPPEDKNGTMWPVMSKLLGNPDIAPQREQILATLAHFEEMLRIRKSSPLFRLRTAAEIKEQVQFHNFGPAQIPGLLVMSLSGGTGEYELIVVLFNADPDPLAFTMNELDGAALALHPIQAASADPIVRTATFDAASKTFSVPGRTTAVFVGKGKIVEIVPAEPTVTAVPTAAPTQAPTPTPVAQPTQAAPLALPAPAQPIWPWVVGGIAAVAMVLVYLLRRGRK